MFFEARQRSAYRRNRELELGRRGAERSRLRNSNEYPDVIKIRRFAHARHQCAAVMLLLGYTAVTPGRGAVVV